VTKTRSESLDFAERWLRDGLQVLHPAFSAVQITVDMTHALQHLEALRQTGVEASPTHVLVRAAARSLAANPDLHQVVGGCSRQYPGSVDIGLSVTGETFVTPVLVVEGADQKSVADIAAEVTRRVPEVQKADRQMLRLLRRWGWLLPLGILRRAVLRLLFASPTFRRKGVGTFQVSTTPGDWGFTSCFSAAGVLIGGQVRSRVMVVDDQPAVRPSMLITLSCDHGVWDGRAAVRFMAGVKAEVERSL
jgi:pyruvate/2-oxoglutarate dehydrogenase complex dihydrolipoamide acyltransferase (E2) component